MGRVQNAFRSAINWIIDKWNGLSFTIPSIDIPGLGKIGGNIVLDPEDPRLAEGGTIIPYRPGGTLVQVAEAGRDGRDGWRHRRPLSRGWERPRARRRPDVRRRRHRHPSQQPRPGAVVDLFQRWADANGPSP